MSLIIDRFEDADLAVLETEEGDSLYLPRSHLPDDAREGDVVEELPEDEWRGDLRYAVNREATAERLEHARTLRATLPQAQDGDLEL